MYSQYIFHFSISWMTQDKRSLSINILYKLSLCFSSAIFHLQTLDIMQKKKGWKSFMD